MTMIDLITWKIHKADGSYIGQSSAFVEKLAFIQCMSLTGKPVVESEIEIEYLPDQTVRIRYRLEDFIVKPLPRWQSSSHLGLEWASSDRRPI